MLHIAICDDEEYYRVREYKAIANFMRNIKRRFEIDVFESGVEIINMGAAVSKYDIIFLDINIDRFDGIETAKVIRRYTRETYIAFVTAFIDYSLDGYKVNAVRYLLKDGRNLEEEIEECLETIIEMMNYVGDSYVFEFQQGILKIHFDDILYIESSLHKLFFHFIDGEKSEYSMYEKLDNMEKLLTCYGFFRVHKSYLVNMKYVKNMERYSAEMCDGTKINISKARYMETRENFIGCQGEI